MSTPPDKSAPPKSAEVDAPRPSTKSNDLATQRPDHDKPETIDLRDLAPAASSSTPPAPAAPVTDFTDHPDPLLNAEIAKARGDGVGDSGALLELFETTAAELAGGSGDAFARRADSEAAIVSARHEAQIAELRLAHDEAISRDQAGYERQIAELKTALAESRKNNRALVLQIKQQAGDDEHRVGDLQAQVNTLDAELTTIRDQLERERVAHLRELTIEREAADLALDNLRREHNEARTSNEHEMRRAIADHRSELERILSDARSEHRTALERKHATYDAALIQDRERHRTELDTLTRRHQSQTEALVAEHAQALSRQADKLKQTLGDLRASEKNLTAEVDELRQAERQYRAELTTARNQGRELQRQHAETNQTLREEIAAGRKALETEKQRNAALRDDVIRRTAEAHQAVDRALDDRSAELAELEALVTRQREQAEKRVRAIIADAEERAREAARREAELSARISRLERELNDRP